MRSRALSRNDNSKSEILAEKKQGYDEEGRDELHQRTLEDKKRFDNFWEGIKRGIDSFQTRKYSDIGKPFEHGVIDDKVS
jgi:hypothetical protein